jgi:hypothetical protein
MGAVEGQSSLAPFVLFLDENHCRNRHLLAVLKETGVPFVSHLDKFKPGLPDTEWLPLVGTSGWCLLTSDVRIRYNELERHAVEHHKLRMFYFSRNNLAGAEMGHALRRALPRMEELFRDEPATFIAAITRRGEVSVRISANNF